MLYGVKEDKLLLGEKFFDYVTFGKGSKPLVMVQGLNTRGIKGAGAMLAITYRIFARDFKVYLFDRRTPLTDGITVRGMADDVAEAMDALGIKEADVFGVSEGGMIAQYLAINRPDLVKKLVLAVTLSKNNETVTSVINNWIELTQKGDMKALVRDMAEKMYSDEYLKKYKPYLPLLTLMQKPKDTERFIALAKSCLTCNAYAELDKIKCPVFVIGGGKDKIVSGAASYEIAKKLNCKIYIYEDLGHAAYEEAKDFNKRVYEFFTNNQS